MLYVVLAMILSFIVLATWFAESARIKGWFKHANLWDYEDR